MFPGIGQSSWTEEVLRTRPPPPRLMNCLAAAWVPKNALFMLVAITSLKSASIVSSNDVRLYAGSQPPPRLAGPTPAAML